MEKDFYEQQIIDEKGVLHSVRVTDKFVKYNGKSIPLNKINGVHIDTFKKNFLANPYLP